MMRQALRGRNRARAIKRAACWGAAFSTALIAISCTGSARACPFCFGSLQLSLREQIEASAATLIVRWKSGDPGDLKQEVPASTTFEVVEVLHGDAVGRVLKIDRYQAGKRGDVFLMSALRLDDVLQWDRSIPLSGVGLDYLRDLPAQSASTTDKLRYAVRFLESADDTVATDAFSVLGSARYEDIAVLKDELPRENLRRWTFGQEKIKGQLGVYGMLMGLCGDETDCDKLEALVLDTRGPDDFRLGISGVMGGYLLLSGTDGLEVLERAFLANGASSASDQAAAMEALRFIGQYAEDRIRKPRLAQSLRRNLATIGFPELAIADLARWQDWSSAGELIQLYDGPQQPDKYVKRAIIQFMILASQANREGLSVQEAAALEAASRFIERLQKDEPAAYQRAERSVVPMSISPRHCRPTSCTWRC
ncbi:MAG: hypothetical protein AB7U20_16355 [Planctomycetaceae bacterium]